MESKELIEQKGPKFNKKCPVCEIIMSENNDFCSIECYENYNKGGNKNEPTRD